MNINNDTERMQRLSHLTIEQGVDGIVWVDSEARICRVNDTLCRMFGYTQEEFLDLTIHDFDPDYQDGDFWIHLEEAKEGKAVFEDRMRRKDGSTFPAEVTVIFLEFEGQAYGCSYIHDITERKGREGELRKALGELERLKRRLEAENIYLQEEIRVEHNFGEIVGQSKVLKKALSQVEKVAPTETSVLILGETGTGKELLARAAHNLSPRSNRPLVKVNCAALPANLIESELFGHEKGAFTGAVSRKVGRFELANGGTIFLDEIGDLPLELQAKLLRVLQEGEFERVGGTATLAVDVRVIAATNRDLEKAMEEGSFREDLYYRLNVFPIQCPPLRERREDIPALVKFFLQKHGPKVGRQVETVPKAVMDTLREYHWPGNVRELENIVERSLILSAGDQLTLGDCFRRPARTAEKREIVPLADMERSYILEALDATGWRVSGKGAAAELLGLKPTTLEARMKKLGIRRKI